uniref:Uncharacterized protein n=1 Tax=viral metagenome TaxID=1070528 RepID=A0A6C0AD43_9ZZZZ
MIEINFSDIPKWLRNSEFYMSLEADDDSTIEIPEDAYKKTNHIKNIKDFEKVYKICKFWIMDYPESFYKWALDNKKHALKFFYSEFDDKNDEINYLIDDLTYSEKLVYKIITYRHENYILILKFSENFIINYPINYNYGSKLLHSFIDDTNYRIDNKDITFVKNKESMFCIPKYIYSNIFPNIKTLKFNKFNILNIKEEITKCLEEINEKISDNKINYRGCDAKLTQKKILKFLDIYEPEEESLESLIKELQNYYTTPNEKEEKFVEDIINLFEDQSLDFNAKDFKFKDLINLFIRVERFPDEFEFILDKFRNFIKTEIRKMRGW